jgi:hypothetical protein
LYANDREPQLIDLVASMPGRTPYLQRASLPPVQLLPSEHPQTPEVHLTRLSILEGEAVALEVTVRPVGDASSVEAWAQVGRRTVPILLDEAADGASTATLWITPSGAAPPSGDGAVLELGGQPRFVQVVASWRREGRVGVAAARHQLTARVVDDRVQVLFPGTTDRAVGDLAFPVWEPTLGSRALQIQAAAGSPG